MVLWKKRGYSEWDGLWCIYGCPSSAHELVDHGDITVLWGVCQHPIDLSDGAAERHEAAYPERVRRQIYGDVAEPAESLSEPLEIQRRDEERGSPWIDRLKRTDDSRRKPVVKVSGIELDYLSDAVAAIPNDETIVSSGASDSAGYDFSRRPITEE
jgi:hypothetical protein